MMQTGTQFTLQRGQTRKGMKLVIAGTVALTATMIASLFLYQRQEVQTIAFYGDNLQNEKTQAFMQFLAKYGKMYATKSDLNTRFEVFSQSYDKVKEHNSVQIERFQMGINAFSDMTEEEFASHYGRKGVLKSTRRPQLK